MGKIVVLGAGVSGLTSALQLLEKGHDVSIVARNFPGDQDIFYTSDYAGANWSSFVAKDDIEGQNIDKVGYRKFLALSEDPAAGVLAVPAFKYITKKDYETKGVKFPWYKDFVNNFRILEKSELPTDDLAFGYAFDTVTISVNVYLHYLLQKIFRLGGTLKRKDVKHLDEAFNHHHSGKKADLVVNATGLLARFLKGVEDKDVYPLKGQIIWARNNITKQISLSSIDGFPDEHLYLFPRKEGGCIIGGTMVPNDWGSTPDLEFAKRTIERAKKFIPEIIDPKLGNPDDIDVLKVNIGLRPARKNGVRIERVGNVIHNYGIGPAGYQASYGLADKVVNFASEYFQRSKL